MNVRDLLRQFRIRIINKEDKEKLYKIIENFPEISVKDRKIFILYYGLENSQKPLKYSDIQKIEKSTYDEIRKSIIKVQHEIINNEEEIKDILLEIKNNIQEMIYEENHVDREFSKYFYDFLENIREKQKVDEKTIKELYELVKDIEFLTDSQKRRFILYYGLECEHKALKYCEIQRIEQCSYTAIRDSISRTISYLSHSTGSLKKRLIEICNYV